MKRVLPTTIRHQNIGSKISVKAHAEPAAGLGLSGWGYEISWKGGGVILCGRVSEENRLV